MIDRRTEIGWRPMDVLNEEISNELSAILLVLSKEQAPTGARFIQNSAIFQGDQPSEATIARRLRELDNMHMTARVGSKGRVLTELGKRAVQKIKQRAIIGDLVDRTQTVENVHDLYELLEARRAFEPHGILLLDKSNLSTLLSELEDDMTNHRSKLPSLPGYPLRSTALQFHRTLAKFSQNMIVRSAIQLLLSNQMDDLEATMDLALIRNKHESHSLNEHEEIYQLIKANDLELAASAMTKHMDRLIAEVNEYFKSYN